MVGIRWVGTCRALYCFDIARSIDLTRAAAASTSTSKAAFQHKLAHPGGAGLSTPLRFDWPAPSHASDALVADSKVEVALYGFGALCITWRIPVDGSPEELVRQSAELYDNVTFTERSRVLAKEVMDAFRGSLDHPELREQAEDYVVFTIDSTTESPLELLAGSREALARILRAEDGPLSTQEIDGALAAPVSYAPSDLCLIDWLGALLLGVDSEDERRVLELATVELFELRLLDARLDREIELAYELLKGRRGPLARFSLRRRELEHLARIQADAALLHEGIDNALKLFGDDYLARLYKTSAGRFHFDDWDGSIQRKLGVLRNVNESLTGLAAHGRSEVLEWMIILLIAIDILLIFTPFR